MSWAGISFFQVHQKGRPRPEKGCSGGHQVFANCAPAVPLAALIIGGHLGQMVQVHFPKPCARRIFPQPCTCKLKECTFSGRGMCAPSGSWAGDYLLERREMCTYHSLGPQTEGARECAPVIFSAQKMECAPSTVCTWNISLLLVAASGTHPCPIPSILMVHLNPLAVFVHQLESQHRHKNPLAAKNPCAQNAESFLAATLCTKFLPLGWPQGAWAVLSRR